MTVRSVITLAAAVGGATTGNPFVAAAATVGGSLLGGIVDPVKVQTGRPLADNDAASTALGRPLVVIKGTYPIRDPSWAYKEPIQQRTSTKRTGVLGTTKVKETKNVATFSRIICEGRRIVLKCWYDGELVYDATNASGPLISESIVLEGGVGVWEFTEGSDEENPFPFEEALFGLTYPGNCGLVREVVHSLFIDRWGRIPTAKYLIAESVTDAFPNVPLDEGDFPGGDGETWGAMWFRDKRHFIAPPSNNETFDYLFKYDSATHSRPVTGDYSAWGGFNRYWVSPHDDWIYVTKDIGATVEIYGIDPETLAVKRWSELGPTGDTARWLAVGGREGAQRIFMSGSNQMKVYDPDALIGKVFDSTTGQFLQQFAFLQSHDLTDFFGGSFVGTSLNGRAIDGDGNCWGSYRIGSAYRIVRFDAASGAPELDHVITDATAIHRIGYAPLINSLYIAIGTASGNVLRLFSLDSETETGSFDLSSHIATMVSTYRNGPSSRNTIFYFRAAHFLDEIDLDTLTVVNTYDLANWLSPVAADEYAGPLYDESQHAIVSTEGGASGTTTRWFLLDRKVGAQTSVKEVTDEGGSRVGLSLTDDLDTTAGASQILDGFAFLTQQPVANDIADVNSLYLNAIRMHDGKLQIKARGTGVDKVLDEGLLGAVLGNEATVAAFIETEVQEREGVPAQWVLNYLDPEKDYEVNNQTKRRAGAEIATERIENLTTNAAISSQLAVDFVTKMEALGRSSLKEYETLTTFANLEVEPGDTVQWLDRTQTLTAFLQRCEWLADGRYRLQGQQEHLELFGLTGTPQLWQGSTDSITVAAASFMNVLDIPHIQPGAQSLALHAVSGQVTSGTWNGQDISESPDSSTFGPFFVIDTPVQRAFLEADLPAGPMHRWDTVNTITLRPDTGTFSTLTESEVLELNNGGAYRNGLLIESDDGTWEVVVFVTATDNGDGIWTLSQLLRGLSNSEEAMNAGHSSANLRVYVISDGVGIQDIPTEWLNENRYFLGSDPQDLERDRGQEPLAGDG